MGKKKSKISKQKQAKAAAKSLKSKVIKEQQHVQRKIVMANKQGVPGDGSARNKSKKKKTLSSSEQQDFQQQQTSMQERHMALIQQEKHVKDRRRGGKNKFSSSFTFQAPTLIVDDAKKPTAQLMKEITFQAQGWDGIGTGRDNEMQSSHQQHDQQQHQHQPQGATAISLKQVFQNSSLQQRHETSQQQQESISWNKSSNRFAALEVADDDNDEGTTNKQEATNNKMPLKFQFAPATFHFTPTITTTCTTSHPQMVTAATTSSIPTNNDIDPDL